MQLFTSNQKVGKAGALSQLDGYAGAGGGCSSPEGCPGLAASAGTELSHRCCCCLWGRQGSAPALAASPATLVHSEVSIENELKLIFRLIRQSPDEARKS